MQYARPGAFPTRIRDLSGTGRTALPPSMCAEAREIFMANTHKGSNGGNASPAVRGAKQVSSGSIRNLDAIELLKSDHRQVEEWFDQFEASSSPAGKQDIAELICHALTVHTHLEEELFYPAFLAATGNEEQYDAALQAHDEAERLIADIEAADAGDLDPKVARLRQVVSAHVADEERPGGLFELAARSTLDVDELGAELEQRKLELMDEGTDEGYDEAVATGGSSEEPEDDEDEA